MNLLRRLWRLEGTVGRLTYFAGGVVGFAFKYAIDWTISTVVFKRPWSLFSYWHLVNVSETATANISRELFLVLLSVSLPFLWFAMAMTLLRLRDANRSAGWAALLFVPFANLILFIALCVDEPNRFLRERDLSGVLESALFAVVASVGLATLAIALATQVMKSYGVGLFVAVPFCVGYLSAFLHRRRHPDAAAGPFVIAFLSIMLLGGFLLAMAWEGALCLVMALPLALLAAMIGAWLGTLSARAPSTPARSYVVIAALPLFMFGERLAHLDAPLYEVSTAIVVDAPIERVWRNVIAFSDIDAEPAWYFRAGLAYPLRASITGRGPGAIRRCAFTTGAFIEPIEVWDEPRLLRFGVTANPAPMQELSPYGKLATPHLDGFLVSRRGQFALRSLPDGKTVVVGTTWYQHHLWPASYWRLWSDAIIHRIHLRVLEHVRKLSERQSRHLFAASVSL